MENPIKYIARFKVETVGPLSIGAGKSGLLNERLIAKDANNLPYIPGTGLAGVVRHEIDKRISQPEAINKVFGYQLKEEGQGSRIVFSPGLLVQKDDDNVVEGLCQIDRAHPYYQAFKRLPERDHVRINHRGTAVKHGKFEEQLVHSGTRFVFEVELEGKDKQIRIFGRKSWKL